jgi:hypothetical protein
LPASKLFNHEIIESAKEAQIIQPVQVGGVKQVNELVFFFKPELLSVENPQKIQNSLDLVEKKFSEFDVTVSGAAIVPGATLEKYEIMNRHYGFINQLSCKASEMVEDETMAKIFEELGVSTPEEYKILGGHEFLDHFETDIDALSSVWFSQKAKKLRSGFYFIADAFQGQKIVLVNGFHPAQLNHFTREDHRIYLMLLHSDTDWEVLKFDLVGDTFPENAYQDSIRGTLYANPEKYGQEEVGINTNGVHLSAGPFEAAFEVVNFFGDLIDLNPAETPPLAIQRAIEAGFSQDQALALLDNPPINQSDLFTETENMNTDSAVRLVNETGIK